MSTHQLPASVCRALQECAKRIERSIPGAFILTAADEPVFVELGVDNPVVREYLREQVERVSRNRLTVRLAGTSIIKDPDFPALHLVVCDYDTPAGVIDKVEDDMMFIALTATAVVIGVEPFGTDTGLPHPAEMIATVERKQRTTTALSTFTKQLQDVLLSTASRDPDLLVKIAQAMTTTPVPDGQPRLSLEQIVEFGDEIGLTLTMMIDKIE